MRASGTFLSLRTDSALHQLFWRLVRRTSFLFMLQLSSFQTGSFSRVEALGSVLMDQITLTFEMVNVNSF